jgi:AcrR family transcriptional regulator
MGADKVTLTLVDALEQARAGAVEQRLYKSGKLAGLFPGRTGVGGEAATRALREGLLEVVRTETKGKTIIEWARLTPRGVNFLKDHESPERILEELRSALQTAREGIPAWQAEMRLNLQALAERITQDGQRYLQSLEALSRRVEDALRRLEEARPRLPDDLAAAIPWARDALAYLEQRSSKAGGCPLPELFAVLADRHVGLSLPAFHDGLRRLREQRVLRLLPVSGPATELPQAEYALFDGGAVLYFAAR